MRVFSNLSKFGKPGKSGGLRKKLAAFALAAALTAMLTGGALAAAPIVWQVSDNGDWDNTNNWDPDGGVPFPTTSPDIALFPVPSADEYHNPKVNINVDLKSLVSEKDSLKLEIADNCTLAIADGGSFLASGDVTVTGGGSMKFYSAIDFDVSKGRTVKIEPKAISFDNTSSDTTTITKAGDGKVVISAADGAPNHKYNFDVKGGVMEASLTPQSADIADEATLAISGDMSGADFVMQDGSVMYLEVRDNNRLNGGAEIAAFAPKSFKAVGPSKQITIAVSFDITQPLKNGDSYLLVQADTLDIDEDSTEIKLPADYESYNASLEKNGDSLYLVFKESITFTISTGGGMFHLIMGNRLDARLDADTEIDSITLISADAALEGAGLKLDLDNNNKKTIYVRTANAIDLPAGTVLRFTAEAEPVDNAKFKKTKKTFSVTVQSRAQDIADDQKNADIRSISITIDGAGYSCTLQPNGKDWVVTVPYGTDLSSVNLKISLAPGATVSPPPPYDCREPVEIEITAPDGKTKKKYMLIVNAEVPPVIDSPILDAVPENAAARLVQNDDGTWTIEIIFDFDADFDPASIDSASIEALGITNTRIFYVDESGNEIEIPLSARSAGGKRMKITGTAANRAAVESARVVSVTMKMKNDAATYRQILDMPLSQIPGGTPGPDPDPDPIGTGSSGGCDAGFGFALTICGAALLFAPKRKK